MKLQIKQILVSFLLVLITILLSMVIYYIGRGLYIFRITNLFIRNREIYSLIVVAFHFLVGYLLINKIRLFSKIRSIYIILSFFIIYILIPIVAYAFSNKVEPFSFTYLKEISAIIALAIGLFFKNKKGKYILILSLVVMGVFLLFTKNVILPLSSQHYLYKTYLGTSKNFNTIENLKVLDSEGNIVNIDLSKTVVLDFYNKNCSICYKKFTIVKKLQRKFKSNDKVLVLAINVYKKNEDIKISEQLLKKTNNEDLVHYHLSIKDVEKYNLQWYPKVVVVKNKKVIFEGNIEILKMFEFLYLK